MQDLLIKKFINKSSLKEGHFSVRVFPLFLMKRAKDTGNFAAFCTDLSIIIAQYLQRDKNLSLEILLYSQFPLKNIRDYFEGVREPTETLKEFIQVLKELGWDKKFLQGRFIWSMKDGLVVLEESPNGKRLEDIQKDIRNCISEEFRKVMYSDEGREELEKICARYYADDLCSPCFQLKESREHLSNTGSLQFFCAFGWSTLSFLLRPSRREMQAMLEEQKHNVDIMRKIYQQVETINPTFFEKNPDLKEIFSTYECYSIDKNPFSIVLKQILHMLFLKEISASMEERVNRAGLS